MLEALSVLNGLDPDLTLTDLYSGENGKNPSIKHLYENHPELRTSTVSHIIEYITQNFVQDKQRGISGDKRKDITGNTNGYLLFGEPRIINLICSDKQCAYSFEMRGDVDVHVIIGPAHAVPDGEAVGARVHHRRETPHARKSPPGSLCQPGSPPQDATAHEEVPVILIHSSDSEGFAF